MTLLAVTVRPRHLSSVNGPAQITVQRGTRLAQHSANCASGPAAKHTETMDEIVKQQHGNLILRRRIRNLRRLPDNGLRVHGGGLLGGARHCAALDGEFLLPDVL